MLLESMDTRSRFLRSCCCRLKADLPDSPYFEELPVPSSSSISSSLSEYRRGVSGMKCLESDASRT